MRNSTGGAPSLGCFRVFPRASFLSGGSGPSEHWRGISPSPRFRSFDGCDDAAIFRFSFLPFIPPGVVGLALAPYLSFFPRRAVAVGMLLVLPFLSGFGDSPADFLLWVYGPLFEDDRHPVIATLRPSLLRLFRPLGRARVFHYRRTLRFSAASFASLLLSRVIFPPLHPNQKITFSYIYPSPSVVLFLSFYNYSRAPFVSPPAPSAAISAV